MPLRAHYLEPAKITLVFGRSQRNAGWRSSALADGPATALPLAMPTSSDVLTDCARAWRGSTAMHARSAAERSVIFAACK